MEDDNVRAAALQGRWQDHELCPGRCFVNHKASDEQQLLLLKGKSTNPVNVSVRTSYAVSDGEPNSNWLKLHGNSSTHVMKKGWGGSDSGETRFKRCHHFPQWPQVSQFNKMQTGGRVICFPVTSVEQRWKEMSEELFFFQTLTKFYHMYQISLAFFTWSGDKIFWLDEDNQGPSPDLGA